MKTENNLKELKDKILNIESQISELPVGYISRKKINGKIKLYHQWSEKGKKISKYVNDETALLLSEQIEERRELQLELKATKSLLVQSDKTAKIGSHRDNTEILIGDGLKQFTKKSANLKARPVLQYILDYLMDDENNKVLILYGLRRTGKTTLIQQAIACLNDENFEKTAFIQIRPGNTLAQLNKDLRNLQNKGYKYILIDEVTLMEDFIDGAALFSDIYVACGMKVVLSGTDSLGFAFSSDDQLYDRCEMIHTTFIQYKEFENVLGIHGIDEYIRYGGTMSIGGVNYNENSTFSNIQKTDEYIDSAIAKNIQHSLKFYRNADHFRHLQELYENNELTSAINRVIEDINHRFTLEVLTKDFISHDLGLSANNLRHDRENPTDILDEIDIKNVTAGLKEALEIRNKSEQHVCITDAHRTEIKEYLDILDLTVDIPVQTLPVISKKDYITVVSQQGLRYSQSSVLIQQLVLDPVFQNISAVDRKKITDRILDEIKGRMMEEIVLLETMKALPQKSVFKLKFAVGEIDMVIYDAEKITCELYEIKHSTQSVAKQYRHITDSNKCRDIEFRFGNITRKCVIYRGRTFNAGEIEYINVEEYLRGL